MSCFARAATSRSVTGSERPSAPAFEEALRELEGATLSTIHGFMRTCLALVAPTMGLDPDLRSLGEWGGRGDV